MSWCALHLKIAASELQTFITLQPLAVIPQDPQIENYLYSRHSNLPCVNAGPPLFKINSLSNQYLLNLKLLKCSFCIVNAY